MYSNIVEGLEYNDEYINKLFDTLTIHTLSDANAEYIPLTADVQVAKRVEKVPLTADVPVAEKVPGGKNTHLRKSHRKTHKKQNPKTI